jgi:hypothetical protein
MSTIVVISQDQARQQEMQLLAASMPRTDIGDTEFTLRCHDLGTKYVQVDKEGKSFDVYVSRFVTLPMLKRYIELHGMYEEGTALEDDIFIDGTPGEYDE